MARANANWRSNAKSSCVPTAGQAFPDGHLIELVADPADCRKSKLLHWDGRKATMASRVEHDGRVYQALELEASISRAMRLPTHATRYGSTRELFASTAGLFKQYLDMPEQNARLLAYSVLSSWFVEFLPSAPGVLISGPDVHRAINLLRLLSGVCRRPLMLAQITPAGLRSLPMYLRPTLLINQPRLTPSMAALLHTSSHRGLYVPGSRGDVLDLYGARVIFSGMDAADNIASSEAIQLSLAPAQAHSAVLGDGCLEQIARELQPQLLMYRLVNWLKVQGSHFDVPRFTFPTRELARNLGACIVDDLELSQRLSSLLEGRDEDVRAQRCTDIRYVIIEVILLLLHKRELNVVRVEKVADFTNTLLRSRGEIVEYSSAEVGWKLRQLGLYRHRDSAGKSLLLNRTTSRVVHQLGRAYGVPRQNALQDCPDCASSSQPIVLS